MILEIAEIYVQEGTGAAFEAAIHQSMREFVSVTEGFLDYELQRGIEDPTRYVLLVHWTTVEAHNINFRESERFPKHRALISPYFAKAPFVQHFEVANP